MTRTWMITGASSGLGAALASAALEAGDRVALAVRRTESVEALVQAHPEQAMAVRLDITDAALTRSALTQVTERFGTPDVLVNNADYGYYAAIEEGDRASIDRLFETNFFGPVRLINAVLPGMRDRGSGMIINVSSAGARRPAPSGGYYSAAKAALAAVSGSLRGEVAQFGIHVMVVEPGTFRTEFRGDGAARAQEPMAIYDELFGRNGTSTLTPQLGDPSKGGQAIVEAVAMAEPPQLLLLGSDSLAWFRDVAATEAHDVERLEELTTGTDA